MLLQQLALLDGFDLQPGTAEFVHTVVECAKLAFADREAWYGDVARRPARRPAGSPTTPTTAARSSATRPTIELRPGTPDGRTPTLPDSS